VDKKCTGTGCPLNTVCARYGKGEVSNYRNYLMRVPFKITHGKVDCEYFKGSQSDLLLVQLKRLRKANQ